MLPLRKQFGRRLKQLRHHNELTQEQLAEKTGVSIDTISLLERGINAPSFETLEKLALALDVSVQMLFYFEHFKEKTKDE